MEDRRPIAVIQRFTDALNRHDVDALVDCCAVDVRAELPAHPARNSRGREKMRANWELIFATVPNLRAEILRLSADGDTVWVEWSWEGTNADGSRFERAGVAIHGIREGRVAWVRLYMQPILSDPVNPSTVALREMGGSLRRRRGAP